MPPHSRPAAAPRTVRTAVARVLSEVFQPPFTIAAALLLSPAASPGWPGTWWFGGVAALFTCVLPFVILIGLVRAGKVVDHHVSERSQRAPVLAMAIVCVLAGLGLLIALGAPASVLAMVAALIAGIAVHAVVSLWWKVSGHAAAVSTAAVSMLLLFGPEWWPLVLVVPAVGWARVMLRAHTPAQVVAGAVFGPLVIVGLWQVFLNVL
ncbi:phosphatase PAP2 family protein [Sinomonas sp. ASV486]|uniref:phosphatase PAP2 family protein n=1 Tax=Sinomonas sp. ASV486 TaxID=3051170 RepID=UPI0027DAE132|nr:phosphatase PAP2 family protein [Sinomonas sp. ASV486]MDQ4489270.1 phosphatase PAP2 family protein [Sinomonas sp. ASV486]